VRAQENVASGCKMKHGLDVNPKGYVQPCVTGPRSRVKSCFGMATQSNNSSPDRRSGLAACIDFAAGMLYCIG
jgi:hypothetical protein